MTVKIAGTWQGGYWVPLTEFDIWQFTLQEFNIDEFCMWPVSGIDRRKVHEYADLQSIIDANPDLTVIFVDEKGTEDLRNFVHPENVLYVFGKVALSALTAFGSLEDRSIKIPTPADTGTLFQHPCAAIVLYDRFCKAV